MTEVIKLYKNLGETPLGCLMRFKAEHSEYQDIKMTYLGRLDPMAEGLLLVLAGNTKESRKYLSLDKTYEFEVLWGFSTDTYDVLGVLQSEPCFVPLNPAKLGSDTDPKQGSLLRKIKSKTTQKYPPFSSKSFGGDFLKAREVQVEESHRAERQIKIFDIAHINTRLVSHEYLRQEIERRVSLVQGDFRQEMILKSWRKVLGGGNALVSTFRADVSSGTYIRGLAHEMGEMLGIGALAWSIKRTRVGEYRL